MSMNRRPFMRRMSYKIEGSPAGCSHCAMSSAGMMLRSSAVLYLI